MTRPFAAVLLAAILGMALVAPVSGNEPSPLVPACEDVRSPAPGFTERQWEMLWELALGSPMRCPVAPVLKTPGCNLFEYLEGRAVVALLHC